MDSNHRLSPCRGAAFAAGLQDRVTESGSRGTRTPKRLAPPPVFKTGSSSGRMPSVLHYFISSGGWNRTNGLLVQSQASLPTATTPDHSLTRTFRACQGSGRRGRTFVSWFKARRPTTSRSPMVPKRKAESGKRKKRPLGFLLSAFGFPLSALARLRWGESNLQSSA